MAKKQRAFFDWRAQAVKIREAGPDFDPSDIDQCNHTELVQLCNILNPDAKAHMRMKRSMLEEILQGVIPDNPPRNKVNTYQSKLRLFIRKHKEKISDQMELDCTGDCYQCHDFMVMGCYVTNADHLEESPEEG